MKSELNLCDLMQVIIESKIQTMEMQGCTNTDRLDGYSKAIQDLAKLLGIEGHFGM